MRGCVVHKPDSKKIAESVVNFLVGLGIEARIIEDWGDAMDYDFIVSVGGDGTILRLLQFIKEKTPPIFGINTGKIGLLTHCDVNFKENLKKALKEFETEAFMRIECDMGGDKLLALNEIAVLTAKPAKMIGIRIKANGTVIEDMRCDGMLFSTPIGSTAYALSTGGPIVDPRLDAILIVPVAPFKLGWKPWVVDVSRRIEAKISSKAFVVADGHATMRAGKKDVLRIGRSKADAVFFRFENRLSRIVEKLRMIR